MKALLPVIIILFLSAGCGSKKSDDPAPAATTWAQVSKIVDTSCATSGCHLSGAYTTTCGDFTASEAKYKAAQACTTAANTPAARLQSTDSSLKMPKSPGTISDADKAILINFK